MQGEDAMEQYIVAIKAALPEVAHATMASRSPQRPFVFVTSDKNENFMGVVGKLFVEDDGTEAGSVIGAPSLSALIDSIEARINEGWLSPTDETGRNTSWDEGFVPRSSVLSFYSPSVPQSIMTVMMALANLGDAQDLRYLAGAFEKLDERAADMDKAVAAIDRETRALFMHYQSEAEKVSVSSGKVRDLFAAAAPLLMSGTG